MNVIKENKNGVIIYYVDKLIPDNKMDALNDQQME
jgi:hypothetical protein